MGKKNNKNKTKNKDDDIVEKNVDFGEADEVKQMLANMAKTVAVGSEWYIVSMSWIQKWQSYVGFKSGDDEESKDATENGPHPGKIDNSDILENGG